MKSRVGDVDIMVDLVRPRDWTEMLALPFSSAECVHDVAVHVPVGVVAVVAAVGAVAVAMSVVMVL